MLDVAIDLLNERGPDGFTIDDVLDGSSSSSSSLYHHFGNREGLVLSAEAERYRRAAESEDLRNLEGGQLAQTTQEFLDYVVVQLRRIVTDPANTHVRRCRLQVAARALYSLELDEETRPFQERMFDAIAEVLEDAKARGLINRDLDTRAYCAWFHGMTVGRTITEGGSIDEESWLDVAIPAALAPLVPRDA